jgi:hypothetical protein
MTDETTKNVAFLLVVCALFGPAILYGVAGAIRHALGKDK